ncbi:MAG: PLP-dependent cysteine synthase family protein [Ruminococcaceae bacterium]|nr:PLP-dependent cysteine synthase family protein [Oscillospiraceae bacterium]
MEQALKDRFAAIEPLIGHTPLLEISFTYKGKARRIFAKAEYYNLTGSIKDRVALYILKKAYENGDIHPGDTIVEATSGNTGISFSAIGRYLGHPVKIYMPDWMSRERIALMESFGATVRLVSSEEGGFLGSIKMTEDFAKQGGAFLPCQFSNEDNTNAHIESTGAEIIEQLDSLGLKADGVVAGVGTGGTVMGISRSLKSANPACKAFPLEPSNSPTLSTGYKVGKHRIYGISDEFIPDLLKLPEMDQIVSVDDGDAICMARKLSETLGIGVGVSSGANFLGSVLAGDTLGDDAVIVTVFADDNKKYLSTDYAKTQTPPEGSLSADISLTGVRVIR